MVIETICNKDIIGKRENGEIRVYAIWGIGGVGKTTLAQSVYNNERVNQYFELKCWVHVSEKFQVKEIMKRIIETIDHSAAECTLTQIDALQYFLLNKLRGKEFLIVLDDVWITADEEAKWYLLSKTLSSGSKRSIVLMTTRSEASSRMMAKVPELQHNLGCLSPEDAWLLFKKFAFEGTNYRANISPQLERIGMEIVQRCKGVPLVVKSLGRLMRSKIRYEEWLRVQASNIWELQETSVLSVLKLSYDNLLPHLKRCFTYCCLFPKGYELKKELLIQLWLSNGFIPPRGDMDLYELGEEIFDSLRSFFQVVKDKKYSNDKYIMHDLMHEVAQQVMRDDCLLIEQYASNYLTIPDEVFHLSSSCPDFQFSPRDLGKLASLRSLFMFGEGYECNISQIFNHVCLRVLYLSGIGIRALPKSISKLKYLRYLNLSHSSIEVLPESIVYLQNLQVLLMSFCYELRELPEGLRYMNSLRILDISYCHALRNLPSGIKQQTRLLIRGLRYLSCTKIRELGNLDCVEISRLEDVGEDEAKSANLRDKSNLLVLTLSWSNIYMRKGKVDMFADQKVLEGLEPNPCLKELSIYFYMGKVIYPNWMNKLNNLVEIGFSGCKLCEGIPPLGKLAELRVIKLFGMDSLEGFHKEDMTEQDTSMFPCLQELNISLCPNLLSLPRCLPKLEILKLQECGALSSLPSKIQSFKGMKELEITGCEHLCKRYNKLDGVDWPKISHIRNITIDSPSYFEDEDEIDESWLVEGVLSHGGYGTYEVHGTLKHKVTLADNDAFTGTRMDAFEDPQQMVTRQHVVQKFQSRQPMPKNARVKQSKAEQKEKQAENVMKEKQSKAEQKEKQAENVMEEKQSKAAQKEKQAENVMKDEDKQAEKVKVSLKKVELRPQWYQNMVSRLDNHIKGYWSTNMRSVVPETMFPEHFKTYVEAESLLALFVNDWVDLNIVFWFTLYFFKKCMDKEHKRCAFLNVHAITGDGCTRNHHDVIKHITTLVTFHDDKEFFLAPYLANDHWSLFIIAPKIQQVYILDSLLIRGHKEPSNYLLTNVIRDALPINLTFSMVQCKQQLSGWECGYMILQYMLDFVDVYHDKFPQIMWSDTGDATDREIDVLLRNLMSACFDELGIAPI